jgi:DNA-binding HxlR family transcriptional regulator
VLGRTYDSQVCSAARALELVGERWSLLIIRDALFAGSTRFNDFRRLGIATNILATRLDGFAEAGLMDRRRFSDSTEQFEYVLTDKGRDLADVVVALTQWGDRWAAPDGPPVRYTHTVCDGAIVEQLTCSTCGEVHDRRQVYVRPGPGMPVDIAKRMRSAPYRPDRTDDAG